MKAKIIQFIPAILIFAIIGFRYFSQWCSKSGQLCDRTYIDQIIPYITYPLYFFAVYSLIVVLVIPFIRHEIFNSWFKFSLWTVPLLLLFIFTEPVYPQSFLSTDRDDAARLAGQIFAIASLILIVWKSVIIRRAN